MSILTARGGSQRETTDHWASMSIAPGPKPGDLDPKAAAVGDYKPQDESTQDKYPACCDGCDAVDCDDCKEWQAAKAASHE